MERLRRAKNAVAERLMRIPGVHTVGIGYKRVGGQLTDELAVVVYVDEKVPRSEVDPEWLVPSEVRFFYKTPDREEVVPTDVVQRSRPVEYPHLADGSLAGRVRPVPGGRSITKPMSGGGTLGGWVWDDINDQAVLLTNNHVLGGVAGTDVFQPWSSNAAADRIADVVRTGSLDATIAAPTSSSVVTYQIEGIGEAVYEIAEAVIGMQVEKSGATTEHTTGVVVAVDLSSHYGATYFEVDRDPGIDRFAYYGDSGSLIVERTHPEGRSWKRVVGLLWGGNPPDRNGFAHQTQDVFADLNLKTVCAGAFEELIDSLFAGPSEMATAGSAVPEPIPGREARDYGRREAPRGPQRWVWPGRRRVGFARGIEKRLARTERGQKIANAVHQHRTGLVQLMLDPELRRAASAALEPMVSDTWSADEVFERTLTADDIGRIRRLQTVAREHGRGLDALFQMADELLDRAEGRRLADLLD
jgi:hypothetical protein